MTQLPEELPELPQPIVFTGADLSVMLNPNPHAGAGQLPIRGYTESQMRAYGLACYQAGLERAAQLVESQKFWEIIPELAADSECADVAGAVMNSMMFAPVAAAIRAEKQK